MATAACLTDRRFRGEDAVSRSEMGRSARSTGDASASRPALVRSTVSTTQPARASRARLILPAFVFGVGFGGLFLLPNHLLYAGSAALWYGLVGLGVYLPMAVLQELPLNAAGLAGLSAYLFASVAGDGGLENWLLGAGVGIGATVAASTLGGLASLAVTGLYFAVASLVVQVGIEKVVFSVGELTGGAGGRGVAQPDLTGWLNTNRAVFLITGVICLAVSVTVWYVKRTRLVTKWVMTGYQPEGADSVGIRRSIHKVVVFALSGALIGIAGCLAAFVNGTPPPVPQFGVIWSVIFLAIALASGMRTVSAVWLVAALFTALPILLESHRINPHFLSGSILLLALLSAQGQTVLIARLRRRPEGQAPGRGTASSPVAAAVSGVAEVPRRPSQVLVGAGIGVSFGGVRAVDNLDVRVAPGQRVAIMGSNGAGKTTLLNALCGYVPVSQGTVTLGDTDLTGLPAYARARCGLGRSFQLPRLADVLTVRQSVTCGHGYTRALDGRVEWLMEHFWVDAVADVPVGMLSFGYRRRTEIVRALVPCPEVLLLDEPVGGLEDEEAAELVDVILGLQATEGWGLLVIEHNLNFVRAVADHLMVMQNGSLITEGPIDQVWDDERVRRIYLGETMPAQTAGI